MTRNYFPNNAYDEIPCGLVAFSIDNNIEIAYANEEYYSHFANENYKFLNINEDDKEIIFNLDEKLKNIGTAEVNYRCDVGKESRMVCMSVRRYNKDLLLGVLWDVTEQYRIIQNLRNDKDKYTMALCASNNIVFENDIIENTASFYIPSRENHTIKEFHISDYESYMRGGGVAPDSVDFFFKLAYDENEKLLSTRMKLPCDKDWKWYRMNRQFVHDEDGKPVRIYGIISNIENEKRHEKELKRKIEMDPMLNIYNRNAAVDRINKYLHKNPDRHDNALLVMDIDDFKNVNDTYGHLYGDTVIEMAANALTQVIGNKGIVGRYGGDEFFAFIKESTNEEICKKADEIIDSFKKFQTADKRSISCSIGVVFGTAFDKAVTYKDMFEKADKALYYVKNTGKAQWQAFEKNKMSEISGRAIGYEALDVNNEELLESKDMMKVFLELSAGAKSSDNVIARIMRYITERFKFDRLRVLYVDCGEDLIAIKHDWCTELDYRSFSSKSGYYVHSDIMRFRNYFEENPVFEINIKNGEGFSLKLVREIEKNMENEALYIANTTSDNYFYMFECVRFGHDRPWKEEELQELNVATKILTMYVSQADKDTEKERKLKEMLDLDRKTRLYSMAKFYEQIGKLRKLAAERDESVVVIHTDFMDFTDFNMKFGQEEGDNVIVAFSEYIKGNEDPDMCINAHIDGTDIFISALRIENNNRKFIEEIENINKSFCNIYNKKYPGANLILKTGMYILKPEDVGGDGLDKAFIAKRGVKDFDESYCILYENGKS